MASPVSNLSIVPASSAIVVTPSATSPSQGELAAAVRERMLDGSVDPMDVIAHTFATAVLNEREGQERDCRLEELEAKNRALKEQVAQFKIEMSEEKFKAAEEKLKGSFIRTLSVSALGVSGLIPENSVTFLTMIVPNMMLILKDLAACSKLESEEKKIDPLGASWDRFQENSRNFELNIAVVNLSNYLFIRLGLV
ncbi:MAG: hypothetical protein K1000chlam4_00586 [Chlamydiae bacterium]|nr:hypothetical protein [Chlamydiota bacterium]